MAELKTKKTTASVTGFLKKVSPESRRQECETLVALFRKVTKEEPRMWGSSIVGFGSYHYVYASGREGDWPIAGFSPRKQNLTVYLMDGVHEHPELLEKLGTFTTGKACLYIKKLEDVNPRVLESLVRRSVTNVKRKHDKPRS